MKAEVKRWIGCCITKIGQNSVGKSHIFGLYDPKIPEELRAVAQKDGYKRRK